MVINVNVYCSYFIMEENNGVIQGLLCFLYGSVF